MENRTASQMKANKDFGLVENDINSVLSVLIQNPKVLKVVLFGSRAKGTFHPGSDVDLALIGNGLSLNDILDASIEIEKLNLPYKFDLIIYDRINEQTLVEHIDRVGVELFKSKI